MDFFNYLLPHCNINKIKLYNIIIKKTIGLDQEIIEAINDFEFNSKLKKELKEEINNSENNKKRKM